MTRSKRTVILSLILLVSLLTPQSPVNAQDDLPADAYISGVEGHAQSYSLSCEARSAADWAAFWGVDANEADILAALPRTDNPDTGFVGDANDPWGYIPPASYGVHSAPIAKVLRSYGLDAHKAKDLSFDDLRREIAAGRPVIVWIIGQMWNGSPHTYVDAKGKEVAVAHFEHTMILIGYSDTQVHVVDAYSGLTQTYPLTSFLASWSVLGNQAVIGSGNPEAKQTQEASLGPAEGLSYTVGRGEYLGLLADRYGLSWQTIAEANHISYPFVIYPGQVIILPGVSTATPEMTNTPEAAVATEWNSITPVGTISEESSTPSVDATITPILKGTPTPEPSTTQTPAPSATATTQPDTTYIVQRGDYLIALARRYSISWQTMADINHISYPWIIYPGQVLHLR